MKIIGIDIGGSKIRGVLWDGKKILKSVEFSTPKTLKKFEKIILRLVSNFSFFTRSSYHKGREIKTEGLKVGIGVAGVIKNNKVVSATNIKYLKNYSFQKKYKIDNDARCYARAEYEIGSGKNAQRMLIITLGTGIGRAYGKNNKILNIKRFEYAEEWEKEYQKIHGKKALAKFFSNHLPPIIRAINPEVVVIGGGVADKKGYYEAMRHKFYAINKKQGIQHTAYSVRRSKLGKFAGAIGAAMLWQK